MVNSLSGLKILYRNYKYNAIKRNLSFDISLAEFATLTSQTCEYCGIEPNSIITGNPKDYKDLETFISTAYKYNGIDRIDNDLGYDLTNCATCCSICNHAKSTMSLADFIHWVSRLNNNLRIGNENR